MMSKEELHRIPSDSAKYHQEEGSLDISSLKLGNIVYISLDEADGLTLTKGYSDRKKFIVIVGFTPEGVAIGALLINSKIDRSKQSPELLDCQYPLLHRHYPEILTYDCWLDCSDIFELSGEKIIRKQGRVKGSLTRDDFERVVDFLRSTDVIDTITKRRFGLLPPA